MTAVQKKPIIYLNIVVAMDYKLRGYSKIGHDALAVIGQLVGTVLADFGIVLLGIFKAQHDLRQPNK